MKTQISTLSKQERTSTFANTMKGYNKAIVQGLKELQAAEEDDMVGAKTGRTWMRRDAITNAGWALDDIIMAAEMILNEAKMAKESYQSIELKKA